MELLNVLQQLELEWDGVSGPTKVIDKMKALLTHVGAWAPKPEQQAVAEFLDNTPAVNEFGNDFKGKIAQFRSFTCWNSK